MREGCATSNQGDVMRPSRILLTAVTAVTAAASFAAPASAEPSSGPQQDTAPYSSSYVRDSTDCWPGTTCTAAGDASSGTGQIAASTDMHRPSADESRIETVSADAGQVVPVRVPKGATRLTATFTWQVRSARASITPSAGFLFAAASLRADGSCSGCTVTDDFTTVVATNGSINGYTDSRSTENVQEVLTVVVEDLPRSGQVRLSSSGGAFTYMGPNVVCNTLPGCDALPTLEENHAGTAHADLDATLTSVDLSYS
jgi:hypothetical protein